MGEAAGAALRRRLGEPEALLAPGVFDGLSAHLVRQAGFEAVYASGGAISRVLGYPDIGLVGMSEMVDHLRYIVDAAGLPVISDADTGYGGAMACWRTARAYGQLGIAALHIEDQVAPKKCGHMDGKDLIDESEMREKIVAAREGAAPYGMLVAARTDAIAVEGFDRALQRAESYAAVGADLIFVEAPENVDQIREIGRRIPLPKMLNMFQGGKTPLIDREELSALGFNLIIVPSDLQRASIRIMQTVLGHIARHGSSRGLADEFGPLSNRDVAVEAESYIRREHGFQARANSPGD